LIALAVVLRATAAPAQETRVVGWGDSLTFGSYDFANGSPPSACYSAPPQNPLESCGHLGRLDQRLNAEVPSWEIEVLNLGKEGEDTMEALSRTGLPGDPCAPLPPINRLKYWQCAGWLQPDDLFVLMEGTNDISVGISRETTEFNLETLGTRAEAFGLEVVIATLIPRHPQACVDSNNVQNQQRNGDIAALAATHGWLLVDTYQRLDGISGLFNTYYQNWDPMCVQGGDPVGHVNDRGYDKITFEAQAEYPLTFEANVRLELPPRLDFAPPAPPIETGTPTLFEVTLHDFATTALVRWSFGDGTSPATVVPVGSPSSVQHVYLVPGPYTVTVTAEHANGGDRQRSAGITVTGADLTIFADGFESGDTSAWSFVAP